MSGEIIDVPSESGPFRAYVSRPQEGTGPGLIVLQEWWGLVPHIMDVCDRFAAEGFVALAPDLYEGKTAEEPDDAMTLAMAMNIGQTEQRMRDAVRRLIDDPATSPNGKVGSVGYCMGGQLSLFAASTNDAIGAAADYYGIHPKVSPSLENIQAPILGIFAEFDNFAPPEAVAALDAELTRLGKAHEFVTYPGTHHAFFNDTSSRSYNAEAAHDAWRRTLAFFRENLSA